jgi:hypothetical protein
MIGLSLICHFKLAVLLTPRLDMAVLMLYLVSYFSAKPAKLIV